MDTYVGIPQSVNGSASKEFVYKFLVKKLEMYVCVFVCAHV